LRDSLEDDEIPRFKRRLEETRFLFIVYTSNGKTITLRNVLFWSMPKEDIEEFVQPVWHQTVSSILEGKIEHLPGASFNEVCHVRPHAKNREDTLPTPHNGEQVKKCFWLNKRYIKSQLVV
jgi:DNA mismatch repair protein MutH